MNYENLNIAPRRDADFVRLRGLLCVCECVCVCVCVQTFAFWLLCFCSTLFLCVCEGSFGGSEVFFREISRWNPPIPSCIVNFGCIACSELKT
jgi:hypothetical protein